MKTGANHFADEDGFGPFLRVCHVGTNGTVQFWDEPLKCWELVLDTTKGTAFYRNKESGMVYAQDCEIQ